MYKFVSFQIAMKSKCFITNITTGWQVSSLFYVICFIWFAALIFDVQRQIWFWSKPKKELKYSIHKYKISFIISQLGISTSKLNKYSCTCHNNIHISDNFYQYSAVGRCFLIHEVAIHSSLTHCSKRNKH